MKRIESKLGIKQIYLRSWWHMILWAWVTALRIGAGWERKDALESFQNYFANEDIDYHSIASQYNHTNKLFMRDYKKGASGSSDYDKEYLKEMIREVMEENN